MLACQESTSPKLVKGDPSLKISLHQGQMGGGGDPKKTAELCSFRPSRNLEVLIAFTIGDDFSVTAAHFECCPCLPLKCSVDSRLELVM